jgi:predicted acyl esterase
MTHLTGFVLILAAISQNAAAQTSPPVTPMTPDVIDKYEQTYPTADFIRRDTMVPMREGTKRTAVVMKKGTANADPIADHRRAPPTHRVAIKVRRHPRSDDAEFVEDGYIRVSRTSGTASLEGQWV